MVSRGNIPSLLSRRGSFEELIKGLVLGISPPLHISVALRQVGSIERMRGTLVANRHARKLGLVKLKALILVLFSIHVVTLLSDNRLVIITVVVRLKSIPPVVTMAMLTLWLLFLVAMFTVFAARLLIALSVTMAVSVRRLVGLSLLIISVRLLLGALLILLLAAIFLGLFRLRDRPAVVFLGHWNTLGHKVKLPLDLVDAFVLVSIVVIFAAFRKVDRSSILFTAKVRVTVALLLFIIVVIFLFFVVVILIIVVI